MSKFRKVSTPVEGLYVIEPTVFEDSRGFFMESWNKKAFEEIGFHLNFVQDNHSKSRKGALRGLHFQIKHPQGKLVRVVKGAVFDIAVDLRKGSPTFGKWYGIILSEENKKMLYIPEGFAHGFLVLTKEADFLYKATEYYYPEYDAGIVWDDPDIGIEWPLKEFGIEYPILSEKDKSLPKLRDIAGKLDF